jgi:hypothetical protein
MIDEPRIVETASIHCARLHIIVPRTEIQLVMGPGIGEELNRPIVR